MRGLHVLLPLAASIAGVVARHGEIEIPEVDRWVHSAMWEFGRYSGYHGPTRPVPYPPRPTQSVPPAPSAPCSFWMENIQHQGVAAFNPNTSYQVFRNVRDFGARGDGVTDDTTAINNAISFGGRCTPGSCPSTTITPAVVYFPAGTYVVSSSIIDYYYTQIIGNPNCLPVLLPTANFTGFGVIDGDPYGANGLSYGSTNVFWRQIRNLIIDMTGVPWNSSMTGIHWPTAQATSIQNVVFRMPSDEGTQHQGIFIEEGSGGFMNDLVFYGGRYGLNVGNQQFTMRNLSFHDAVTAINQIWDWGWTYKGININNCSVGLNMSSGGPTAQSVGSVTFFDSSISNTPIGVLTAHNRNSQPPAAGSLILENVQLNNVPIAVQGPEGTVSLAGSTGSRTIAAWGQGHAYTPNGPIEFQQAIPPNPRPGVLVSGGRYYERSKPHYENVPASGFVSARSAGARGDGTTDDTNALQGAIFQALRRGRILFVDHGTYRVTRTIYIPANSKIVGESFSVIMSSGSFFANANAPQPVVRVGRPGEGGAIEWSDMIVSTQGAQAGAILIEWNLATYGTPSGMWDVHIRIGGFAGSSLTLADCPTTPTVATINPNCIAAYMGMHVTRSAAGLYMENVWLWTADHDIEDLELRRITIFTGRGLYIESQAGTLWLYGTGSEHFSLYQYQLVNTRNIFMGQIQTETAYWQPNPNATYVFNPVASINDPTFTGTDAETAPVGLASPITANGWGLRVVDSSNILVYGAGLYSFFNNYSTNCSAIGNGAACQAAIFTVEGNVDTVNVYNLNTVGTTSMINRNGMSLASYDDNMDGFVQTIALFRSNGPALRVELSTEG